MLRYFGFSVGRTVAALVTAVWFGGAAALLAVAVLGVLEVCLSFDNAVVNAKVLRRMSPLWRKLFLYVGIFIAVFGMRLLLPIVLVSVTASLSIPEVWDLALSDQEAYASNVESAAEAIYTFGGIFLLMIFLNFLFDEEREVHWLSPIERPLAKAGKLPYLAIVIALAVIYVGSQIADDDKYATVLMAGLAGLFTYLLIGGLNEPMEAPGTDEDQEASAPRRASARRPPGPTRARAPPPPAGRPPAAARGGRRPRPWPAPASPPSSTSRCSTRRSPSTASSARSRCAAASPWPRRAWAPAATRG